MKTNCILSHHAEKRCQQRGISTHTLDLLMDYGLQKHVRDGGISYFFTRKHIRDVSRFMNKEDLILMEKQREAYIVVGASGEIITAAWRKHH